MRSVNWLQKRRQVCLPRNTIYLNAGSFSPLPKPVLKKTEQLRRLLAEDPMHFHLRVMPGGMSRARDALAKYVRCKAEDLLLLNNTTFALNMVIRSLKLSPGDEVIFPDQEYGAMKYCFERLALEQKVVLREVKTPLLTSGGRAPVICDVINHFEASRTDRTRVLFFSHVSSPLGFIFPAKELAAWASKNGLICIIDGAHAPGMLTLDLENLGCDFYAANIHKWMMGPTGSGFLWVHPSQRQTIEPLVVSWGWKGPNDLGYNPWIYNLEFHGTKDQTPFLVIPEVLKFRSSLGGDRQVVERCAKLADYCVKKMAEIGLDHATPSVTNERSFLSAFYFDKIKPWDGMEYLQRHHRIHVIFTTLGEQVFLRVSTAWFNTEGEIDRLAGAIRMMRGAVQQKKEAFKSRMI